MTTLKQPKIKIITLLLSGIFSYAQLPAALAEPIEASVEKEIQKNKSTSQQKPTQELSTIQVIGSMSKDNKGYYDVYHKNVSNVYVGKEYLERYQTSNSADVFKGLNGVYSQDARNGNAITPNIRGLSGEGRTPLTVDGTEQSLNTWLHIYGAGNRSYVDPALFRSIAVEKSPSLTRGIKSGVGGSIQVRTIEPEDIIPEGKNWGINLKYETSSNSIKRPYDPQDIAGTDYRDIPGVVLGGSPTDNVRNVNIPQPMPRTHKNKFINGKDNLITISSAFSTELTDGLLSYSYRNKGNYFSGKNGASKYYNNSVEQIVNGKKTIPVPFIPNMAKIFHPGEEIFNTANKSSTVLIKNNWKLPNNQKIMLSYMSSDLHFGEYSPYQSLVVQGLSDSGDIADPRKAHYLMPESTVKQKTYKVGYQWKPEDNKWLDIEASAWGTQNQTTRYQSGGGIYYVKEADTSTDAWDTKYANWQICQDGRFPDPSKPWECLPFNFVGFDPNARPAPSENIDGKYNIFLSDKQYSRHDRWGSEISNVIKLRDNLKLTVSGDMQYEKLKEEVSYAAVNAYTGGPSGSQAAQGTYRFGPRSGRRHEWGLNMNFDWSPTSWLDVSIGTRYNKYWAYDDELARHRRNKDAGWEKLGNMEGKYLPLAILASDEETWVFNEKNRLFWKVARDPSHTPEDVKMRDKYDAQYAEMREKYNIAPGDWDQKSLGNGAMYWNSRVFIPYKNGKPIAAENPFLNGQIDRAEIVTNPQPRNPKLTETTALEKYPVVEGGKEGTRMQKLSEEEKWAIPERQKGSAWSPVLSFTLKPTDSIRIYGRYAQMTRFPSLFEIAAMVTGPDNQKSLITVADKPERSRSWEIAYAQDFSSRFASLQQFDIRLGYFSNSLKDFIDRDQDLYVIQYDKKKTTGIELQSRIDNGTVFANLGVTYRLKQEVCDENFASQFDLYNGTYPNCVDGGFDGSMTLSNLQPKYSVNLDLGTRLLKDKLVLGMRGIYHSKTKNKTMQNTIEQGFDTKFAQSGIPMSWHSVLVLDAYAQYQINKNVDVNFGVTNLGNKYYIDPMAKVGLPAPGRTFTVGVKGKF